MWIAQSELTSTRPAAPLHIYYLFDNSNKFQKAATRMVELLLEGETESGDVASLQANAITAGNVEGEVWKNQSLWQSFAKDLPCVVLMRRPVEMVELPRDEVFLLKLNRRAVSDRSMYFLPECREAFACHLAKLRRLELADFRWRPRETEVFEARWMSERNGIYDAIEIVGNVPGFKVNFALV